jgi:hypothetical protein
MNSKDVMKQNKTDRMMSGCKSLSNEAQAVRKEKSYQDMNQMSDPLASYD